MRKNFTLLCLFVFCAALFLQANAGSPSKWTATFNSTKSFVENKSQFNGKDLLKGSDILYGAVEKGAKIYFTKSGLTYRFDKIEPKTESKESRDKDALLDHSKTYQERESEEH